MSCTRCQMGSVSMGLRIAGVCVYRLDRTSNLTNARKLQAVLMPGACLSGNNTSFSAPTGGGALAKTILGTLSPTVEDSGCPG